MYGVFLWIPSKGWKHLLNTKSQRKAIDFALSLTPLEVQLQDPHGRLWKSGICHVALNGCHSIAQIESLNDSISVPV
jgi:hypothetical protein